ncbi:MAG: hypothetical protein NWQ45_00840, partial [Congregibacter sp.]|nr:hypothetical protein [Congregibacter sp.]
MSNLATHGSSKKPASTMDPISRFLVVALAILVLAVLAGTLVARLTGFSLSSVPASTIVDVRELGFRDLPNGVVEVFEWHSKTSLAQIPSGEGAF